MPPNYDNQNSSNRSPAGVGAHNAFDPQVQQSVVAEALTKAVIEGAIPPLTAQQIKFITWLQQGLTYPLAARAVGCSIEDAVSWGEDPRVQRAREYADTLRQASVIVTRDMLTLMLLEERSRADTSTAAITAIREIGRLNALYPEQILANRQAISSGMTIDAKPVNAEGQPADKAVRAAAIRKKLEAATDDQLLEMGGVGYELEPQPRQRKDSTIIDVNPDPTIDA